MNNALAALPASQDSGVRCTLDERKLTLSDSFELANGTVLDSVQVGIRMCGRPDGPVSVVLGGISANRCAVALERESAPGWWQAVLGEAGVNLPSRGLVLGIDYLAGCGATTGPDSWEGAVTAFPRIDAYDQARLVIASLDALGIARIDNLAGASYGGMVALQLAQHFPDRIGRMLVMASAHRPEPMAVARRHAQKKILRLAAIPGAGRAAVAAARALAMTTYRTAEEFRDRFGGPDGHDSLASYLDFHGERFSHQMSPISYLRMIESIDSHRVDPAQIEVPTMLVGFEADEICPIPLLAELATLAPGIEAFIRVPSIYGHDAFLCESGAVIRAFDRFLQGELT